jgi:hypothetical protein
MAIDVAELVAPLPNLGDLEPEQRVQALQRVRRLWERDPEARQDLRSGAAIAAICNLVDNLDESAVLDETCVVCDHIEGHAHVLIHSAARGLFCWNSF